MEVREHIVDFHTYCQNCQFKDTEDYVDPCHSCLAQPTNEHSRKPINFKQREFTKKEKKELEKQKAAELKKQKKKG